MCSIGEMKLLTQIMDRTVKALRLQRRTGPSAQCDIWRREVGHMRIGRTDQVSAPLFTENIMIVSMTWSKLFATNVDGRIAS